MVWAVTLAASADVDAKVGAGVSASFTEAMKNSVGAQAESYICALAGYNFIDNYSSMNPDFKAILTEYVSSVIAMYAIAFDMSGYTTRMEAEVMLSLNWARIEKIEELFMDQDRSDNILNFIKA